MSKSLAEQLARFGFKSKTADAIEAPEGFDEETVAAPEVAETQVEEVTSTEVAEAEAPKAEVSETVEEAPKAEEAPKTEEAAPAQVETPVVAVEAAPTTEPAKKSPKSVSRMRIVDKDVDIDITSIGEVKPISNKGLRKFREDIFGRNPLKEVPRECIIDGVLAKGTGLPCVWEEGGADMASGYALLVADKNGNKKAPLICLHDKDVSNGKHALMPVAEGDLILLGVMKKFDDETQMCCIIGAVTRIDAAKDERVLITISPAFCAQVVNDDPEVQYTDDSLAFIDAGHPLLQAGMERVQERFCHEPKYVRAYVPYKFNKIGHW